MITKVYYSVSNCGDGSAYPQFFESEKCSNFHQYLLNEYGEGWGEDCVGELEIESDGPVKIKRITTNKSYIDELKSELDEYKDGSSIKQEIKDFISEIEASIREEKINNIIKD